MEPNKDVFQYTYSAKQQEEIEAIRKKYLPPQEDKMEQLRRLDKSATKKGTALSIVVGVAGCLLMGVGMCCSMVWMGNLFIPGIILGLLGIALVAGSTRVPRPAAGMTALVIFFMIQTPLVYSLG